jgi:hypothetical protein
MRYMEDNAHIFWIARRIRGMFNNFFARLLRRIWCTRRMFVSVFCTFWRSVGYTRSVKELQIGTVAVG